METSRFYLKLSICIKEIFYPINDIDKKVRLGGFVEKNSFIKISNL